MVRAIFAGVLLSGAPVYALWVVLGLGLTVSS
jgi:hypothetical protein